MKLYDHATARTSAQLRQISLSVGKLIRQEDVLYYQSPAVPSAATFTVEGLTGIGKHSSSTLAEESRQMQSGPAGFGVQPPTTFPDP